MDSIYCFDSLNSIWIVAKYNNLIDTHEQQQKGMDQWGTLIAI